MKLTRILPFILILSACTPAATLPPSTPIPPTETATSAPSATFTFEPTATSTNTPEPTKVPIPEGWTAVTETKEIGGRQVVLNEKGDAATQIDGEWYPVDARGCFYREFFDPANQTDPRIDELIKKINGELSMNLGDGYTPTQRSHGAAWAARTKKGGYPRYTESNIDAILYVQTLCYNGLSNRWEHVLQYVHPYDSKETPDTTKVVRGVVGWLDGDAFESFTYREDSGYKKAETVNDSFQLWQDLIDGRKQIAVRIPDMVRMNDSGNISPKEFEKALRDLVGYAHTYDADMWKEDITDPKFLEWALSEDNILKYMSMDDHLEDVWTAHREIGWRYQMEKMSSGEMPELMIRAVRTQ